MRGIVLAGGSGTRLYPLTASVSKQLLPVYDKPTIYYPLSVLMMAGIREILIISTPRDLPVIERLLSSGAQFGLKLQYKVQEQPDGIAQAFILGEEFIRGEPVAMILGDNIYYGGDLGSIVKKAASLSQGAIVFAYKVSDPENFGVIEIGPDGRPSRIVEKPKSFVSPWVVTGLYFYDGEVSKYAKSLKPSARGELEITDLNNIYLKNEALEVQTLGRGFAWLDTGHPDSLLTSAQFVQTIEKRQGLKIACLEEIAYRMNFITKEQMSDLCAKAAKTEYGKYLKRVLEEPRVDRWDQI